METDLIRARQWLFKRLRREIDDEKVMQAISQVPRELFVSAAYKHQAYENIPLSIGEGQTISQPYIVALMTSTLELQETDRVLEVGTGSGYQAAILARLVPKGRVVTVERMPSLAFTARDLLQALGYTKVDVKVASDRLGCPEEGPFDAIIVTASVPRLPDELIAQMTPQSRMVIPIGSFHVQELVKVLKSDEGHSIKILGPCRFVPLIGEGAWPKDTEA